MGGEGWIVAIGSGWIDGIGGALELWPAVAGLLALGLAWTAPGRKSEKDWETLLEESEERWRRLVEEHPEPIYVTVNGRIRYINPSGLSVFGAERADELIGEAVMSFVHPDVHDVMRERLAQVNRGEETEPLEHRMIRRDGQERIVVTRTVPIRYEGQAAGQTVIRDVTEQRRAEAKLKRSEYLLDETLRQMPAGVIIVDAPSGKIVQYNDEAQRLLGHDVLPAGDVSEYGQYAGYHLDGTPYDADEYPTARALRGETVINEEMKYQRSGDGSIAILSVSAAPIRDEGGRLLRAVCTFQDITERKQMEVELRNSEALYEALTRNYPLGAIVVFDSDLRYLLVGGEGLQPVDLAADQMIGKTIWDVFPPETCDVIEPDYRAALDGERVINEVPYKDQVYLTHTTPVRNRVGTVIAGMVVTMNITQRKRAEARLMRTNRLLERTQRITGTGGWVYDLDAETVTWTAEVRRIHGVDSHFELTPQTAFSFFLPTSRPKAERAIQSALEKHEDFKVELEIMTARKRRRWVEVRGEPEVKAGRVTRIVGTVRDITRQKGRIERLRLLDAAVEHANDMVIVTEAQPLDAPGPRIVYVNEAFEQQTGYTRGEAIGQSPRMLQGPDTERQVLDRIRAGLEHDEPVREEVLNYRKDGTPYWIDLSIVPVATDDGTPTHYLSVQRDITERREAEQALRRSEERFRGVSEQAIDVIALLDGQGQFKYLSPSVEEVTGFTREELANADGFGPVHPDDMGALREAFQRAIRQPGTTVEAEARYRHRDGSWRHLSVRGRRLPTSTADVEVLANVRDITARKETEQALIAAKEEAEEMGQRHEMALLGADLGFWDLDLNTWTNVVNERWAEMLGYTLDEVGDSQNFFETHVHPDDLQRAYKALDRHARGEIPMVDVEIRMRAKDGSWRWIQDRGKIMEWNDDGSPRRAVGTHLDITERKRRVSIEQRFGRLLDASVEEIYVFDAETLRFTQVSRGGQENLGYSMEALRAMTPLDIKPFGRPDLEEYLHPLRTGEQDQVRFETIHRRADGSTYPVEVHLQVSRQEDPPVFLAIVLDITERKQHERDLVEAKEEAEEMSRLKTAFLANMSHEIRTPLTAIIGFADVLSSQVEGEATELLKMIRESGKRLEMTLTSVLDLAQLESHTMSLSPEWTDVDGLVRNVAQLFQTKAESCGIDLIVDTPPERVPAYLDATALQRIVMNLIANAIKFTSQGHVTVRVRKAPEADAVRIAVEDTGIGIPADRLDSIFTEFTQASQGYTRNYEGSGLGLTISQELAELLGGTIEVESTEGQGSLFTVQVPHNMDDASPAEVETVPPQREAPPAPSVRPERAPQEAPLTPSAPTPDAPHTVLLVEDNALTREVLPLLIQNAGEPFTIETAGTAEEALDMAAAATYDIFLIDINLGATETTGIDVMNMLRNDARYTATPMIACTAYAMPGDEEQFLEAGFDAYLAKPFRKDELIDVMAGVLQDTASP